MSSKGDKSGTLESVVAFNTMTRPTRQFFADDKFGNKDPKAMGKGSPDVWGWYPFQQQSNANLRHGEELNVTYVGPKNEKFDNPVTYSRENVKFGDRTSNTVRFGISENVW